MAAGDYGTSSIKWERTEPKTWTLTNTEQYGGPPPPSQIDVEAEKLLMQRMMQAEADSTTADTWSRMPDIERADVATPGQKRVWRQQQRRFLRNMRKSDPTEFDSAQGIQEMIDSGALRYDEDGLSSSVEWNPGRRGREAMVAAADEWADKVGLWHGGDFDPSRYEPYGASDTRMQWEEMQKSNFALTPSDIGKMIEEASRR